MATATRKNSRQKGARIEREAVHLLQRLGFDARRGQQHRGGPDSPDVICEALPHIEVKGNQDLVLGGTAWHAAMSQAASESPDGEWILLWKPDRKPWRLSWRCGFWGVPVTVVGEAQIRTALEKMSRP